MLFHLQLKKYRKLRGLTQKELAKKISEKVGKNHTSTMVSTWERGVSPNIKTIYAIAEILDIPVQFLFDDSEETISKIIINHSHDQKLTSKQLLKVLNTIKENMEHLEQIIKAGI